MKRERIVIVVNILLVSTIFSCKNIEVSSESEQQINAQIDKVSWVNYTATEGKTVFEITTNISVYNPNINPLVLHYGRAPGQVFGTELSMRLKERGLKADFECNCNGLALVECDIVIECGWSKWLSRSYLVIAEENYATLPDGDYEVGVYLFIFEELLQNSTKALISVENGIHTINYDYSITANFAYQYITIINSIIVIYTLLLVRMKRM